MEMESPTAAEFECPWCRKRLRHRYSLRRHVSVVHEGVRRYLCPCGKRFATKEQLTRHTNSKHTMERPYICQRGCAKSFASYTARAYHHRATHDHEKHPCPVFGCGKQYCTRLQLEKHLARPHNEYLALFNLIYWFRY